MVLGGKLFFPVQIVIRLFLCLLAMGVIACSSPRSKWVCGFSKSNAVLRDMVVSRHENVSRRSKLILRKIGEDAGKWERVLRESIFGGSSNVCLHLSKNYLFYERAGIFDFELYGMISNYACYGVASFPKEKAFGRVRHPMANDGIVFAGDVDAHASAIAQSMLLWRSQSIIGIGFMDLHEQNNLGFVDQWHDEFHAACANILYCIWMLNGGGNTVPEGLSGDSFYYLLMIRTGVLGAFRSYNIPPEAILEYLDDELVSRYGVRVNDDLRGAFEGYLQKELVDRKS